MKSLFGLFLLQSYVKHEKGSVHKGFDIYLMHFVVEGSILFVVVFYRKSLISLKVLVVRWLKGYGKKGFRVC